MSQVVEDIGEKSEGTFNMENTCRGIKMRECGMLMEFSELGVTKECVEGINRK